ncbi:MAG TPA: MipA/OmpV family protein [Sphingobium sp.]|uniref:MipA/OmpV family protein n=1 Tax=Sphingobium sp. TaxID=1912891 RepID=UPI002ED61137
MINRTRIALAAFAMATLTASPALAQGPSVARTIFDGDYVIVGLGASLSPSYEGSNDYTVFPVPVVAGRIAGVGITPRSSGIALDFIKDPQDAKISFQLGPVFSLRFDRHGKTHDPVVETLGRRDIAVEIGGNAGFSINRITNGYDSLTFSVDVKKDVAGAHDGVIISPNISYITPLSKGALLAINASADHVDSKYASYYYSVTPSESIASGLPVYNAQSGWKDAQIGILGALDLDGDLTNGGFSVFVAGNYERLLGNFERAPVVDIRGSPNQWTGAVGVAYVF